MTVNGFSHFHLLWFFHFPVFFLTVYLIKQPHGKYKLRHYKWAEKANLSDVNVKCPSTVSFCLYNGMNHLLMCFSFVRAGDWWMQDWTESENPVQLTAVSAVCFVASPLFFFLSHFGMSQASSHYPSLPCAHSSFLLQTWVTLSLPAIQTGSLLMVFRKLESRQ